MAGNVTANAAGQSFVYDAEQHQIEVKVTSTSATVASYKYDGSGQRVKKIVGTEETTFIYDAMGKSVAEYVLNSTTTPDVHTRYVTQDQLGSPRVITDGTGQVQERHDYLAYGEEAGSGLSTVRTSAQKYAGTSAVRKRYTGYERDDESGLDYAQARYYNSAHGRFSSVDPLTASATIKNPQTFNRYSYALNSPYKFTDPLGLRVQYTGVNDPALDPPPYFQDPKEAQQGTTSTLPDQSAVHVSIVPNEEEIDFATLEITDHADYAFNNQPVKDEDGKPVVLTDGKKSAPAMFAFGTVLSYQLNVPEGLPKPMNAKVSESVTATVDGKPVDLKSLNTVIAPHPIEMNGAGQARDNIGIQSTTAIPAGPTVVFRQEITLTADYASEQGTVSSSYVIRVNQITLNQTARTITIEDITPKTP